LKDAQAQAQLAAYSADLLVVVAYGLLLPEAVLEAPRLGCINVHASLLPRWRGAAPIERAIEAGDSETGVTIMQMDIGLDTGNMLLKRMLPIDTKETGDSLRKRLAPLGISALSECLEKLTVPGINSEKQDDSLATYASKLEKEEALLDWQLSAMVLERKVRAYHSSNITYTWLNGQRVRAWMAKAIATDSSTSTPGTILASDKTGILVACGEGQLRLTQLQLPGGKALPAAQLLNAKAELFQAGFRFSNDDDSAE
jgi:methionyl-tRNA formyltransferase